ncbi:L-fucose/L-arabinose isomerase family protein [Thaumasiovibrio subtropicus]|uniref:L-fucose/L-arabinose isomerase family protein n=1 Tax=Thaumasiovibrio subtropicus TaxID=1891207 RepID=UPI000B34FE58|nr:hypothetical protein [Thaumasiovibrio subtropicus]
MTMKVAHLSLGFPNFRFDIAQQYLTENSAFLRQRDDIQLLSEAEILIDEQQARQAIDRLAAKQPELVLVECGTYSFGSVMMYLIETFRHTPMMLIGYREPLLEGDISLPLNSLCGVNMFASFMKKVGKTFSYCYGTREENLPAIDRTIKAVKVRSRFRRARFCLVGGRVPGFYLSNVDELNFRDRLGAEIIYYDLSTLIRDAKAIENTRVDTAVEGFRASVAQCLVSDDILEKSARVYLALMDFKAAQGIDGFAIKCWPEFQSEYQFSVCGVVSRLNNEGIMTACEGDIAALATMFIHHSLYQTPCFLADLVNVNEVGHLKAWHCGPAAPQLARFREETAYTTHPTIKQGIGMAAEFRLQLGRVTMLKLHETSHGYQLFTAMGTGVEEDRPLCANQLDIQPDVPAEAILDTIMAAGIEHHYVISYSDDLPLIKEVAKWLHLDLLLCGGEQK